MSRKVLPLMNHTHLVRLRTITRWPLVGLLLTLLAAILIGLPLSFVATNLLRFPSSLLLGELLFAVVVVGATLLVTLLIQGDTLEEAGFRLQGALRDLAIGFGVGTMLLALSVGLLALFGGYHIVGVATAPQEWWAIAEVFALMALVGLAEETLFRGILFRYLEAGFGSWVALLLTSALFGAVHLSNPAATLWGAAAIAVEAGIMLGAAYMLTRSLWLAIGIHWGWNFVQGSVFGFNVSGSNLPLASVFKPTISGPELLSGGAFGIEASLIAVVVCTLFGVALLIAAVRRGHVVTPCWLRRLLGRGQRDGATTVEAERALEQ